MKGAWINSANQNPSRYFANVSTWAAARDTRQMSIVLDSNETSLYAWLAYESPVEGITILRGSFLPLSPSTQSGSSLPNWTWKNTTGEIQASSNGPPLQLGAPCAMYGFTSAFCAGKHTNGSYSSQGVQAQLYNPNYD